MNGKKALSLISSGIDSPVATWMMQQKGVEVVGVHFSYQPLAESGSKKKVLKLCKHLGIKRLYAVSYGPIMMEEVSKKCNDRVRCILCKRLMLRISEKIAEKEGCLFLIMGDNLGQVASQTLENMAVITSAVKIPILRPLLCNDKQETVDIAKKIGTYEISIDSQSCCPALPKQPATKSVKERIEAEEAKVEIDKIVEEAVNGSELLLL